MVQTSNLQVLRKLKVNKTKSSFLEESRSLTWRHEIHLSQVITKMMLILLKSCPYFKKCFWTVTRVRLLPEKLKGLAKTCWQEPMKCVWKKRFRVFFNRSGESDTGSHFPVTLDLRIRQDHQERILKFSCWDGLHWMRWRCCPYFSKAIWMHYWWWYSMAQCFSSWLGQNR